MGKQSQLFIKEAVYQTRLRHAFSAAVQPVANIAAGGTFPAVATKLALSAAQSSRVLQPHGITSLASGNGSISLDDANDRIMLEPGVYRVDIGLCLLGAGGASDFHVGLTTAAAAANDVEYETILGANLAIGATAPFHSVQYITVTSARALELHAAWVAAAATGTIRPGSYIEVTRVGNVE
jgi:hypothetical protein